MADRRIANKNVKNKNMRNKNIGGSGEEFACKVLLENGYEIIDRNYRNKIGEIDIIGRKGDYLVFFEVKTRTSKTYGVPALAVDTNKQRHITNVATCYLQNTKMEYKYVRFDVIEVSLNHITDAF